MGTNSIVYPSLEKVRGLCAPLLPLWFCGLCPIAHRQIKTFTFSGKWIFVFVNIFCQLNCCVIHTEALSDYWTTFRKMPWEFSHRKTLLFLPETSGKIPPEISLLTTLYAVNGQTELQPVCIRQYHNSHNASVIRHLPVPVPAKRTQIFILCYVNEYLNPWYI